MKKISSLIMIYMITLSNICIGSSPYSFDDADTRGVKNSIFKENAVIFSGNATNALANSVSEYLDTPLGKSKIKRFNDGEISIRIKENVRNKDVFIIQSCCSTLDGSVNDNLMELFLMVRTMKRSSASSITAVIPYYAYARQDRKTEPRVPISAADVAMMLEVGGVDRVVTIDLHAGQIQGFFQNAPVDNLFASSVFVPYFAEKELENVVVVSPDAGGVDRSKIFLESLNTQGIDGNLAIISKQRSGAGVVASMSLIGDVAGADAIIVDDMCDTGGTLCKAAQLLKDEGARRVFAVITHPVFSGAALEKVRNSVIEEMVIADTIPLKGEAPDNLKIISVGPLLGEAIRRIQLGESVSDLFE
jgi:ribose-phosphate pyrophosphokinase